MNKKRGEIIERNTCCEYPQRTSRAENRDWDTCTGASFERTHLTVCSVWNSPCARQGLWGTVLSSQKASPPPRPSLSLIPSEGWRQLETMAESPEVLNHQPQRSCLDYSGTCLGFPAKPSFGSSMSRILQLLARHHYNLHPLSLAPRHVLQPSHVSDLKKINLGHNFWKK